MGTYGLKGVMQRWEAGQLTCKQAIGQMLQLMKITELRLNELERRQRLLWREAGLVHELPPGQEEGKEGGGN
jgi:hypothetical protein